jgi:predicted metal-dependent hydrolase
MLCDITPKSDESLRMTSEAFALFKHAANHSFASAKARFQAAVRWAQEARRRKHQSTVKPTPNH